MNHPHTDFIIEKTEVKAIERVLGGLNYSKKAVKMQIRELIKGFIPIDGRNMILVIESKMNYKFNK